VLLASHRRLSGPRGDPGALPAGVEVVEESHTDKQSTLLVRTDEPVHDPSWIVKPVSMEDLVLGYMSRARDDRARRLEVVSCTVRKPCANPRDRSPRGLAGRPSRESMRVG
jgi:ABC-2 type transport system ATP-binding protein